MSQTTNKPARKSMYELHFFNHTTLLLLLASILIINSIDVCTIGECGLESTELKRWDCVGHKLFAPLDAPKVASTTFVEHDCGGVGWGNSIRALFNVASIAAVLSRRLIVTGPQKAFNRMFDPPYADSWDYGFAESCELRNVPKHLTRQSFDYENNGRPPGRFSSWVDTMYNRSDISMEYKSPPILQGGICGGEREFLSTSKCIDRAMPMFSACLHSDLPSYSRPGPPRYMHDPLLHVPFFYSLFRKPSARMARELSAIRRRLRLPQVGVDQEGDTPGSWGLRTPGHYILGLHFRRVPVGFEPLSIELNERNTKQWRLGILENFWDMAGRYAEKAAALAHCRNETLLIYFATDDVHHLRAEAKRRLTRFGRVVFGLLASEVGHVSPQWTAREIGRMSELQDSIRARDGAGEDASTDATLAQQCTSTEEESVLACTASSEMIEIDKTEKAVERHGLLAMVEWWILAHSNWLVTHSGTSFSDTAAGVGLGPLGVMERIDIVHGKNHALTEFRREWHTDSCTPVAAADPTQAMLCPNML